MRIRVGDDGEWYDFDPGRLLVKEARLLEELTGMGLQDFSDGMKRGKVDSLVFMLFLARRRAGEAVQWRQFDELDITQLQIRDDEDEDAAALADAAGPDTAGEGNPVGDPEGDPAVAAPVPLAAAGKAPARTPAKRRTRK